MMAPVGDTQLGEISKVEATLAWGNEVRFSEWLATNLGRLSEILGVGDLELVGRELPVGDFRCDIVAKEVGSNRVMIIENQFTKTDHDHLGKLLTYAARQTATIVVWISPSIRDEHRAAIDWLNRMTLPDIGFFAVELRVISIDGSRPAPLMELRSSPNDWAKPTSVTEGGPSAKAESYRQFFQPLIDELREKHRFTNARASQPASWYSFASGTRGFNYMADFASGNRMRAGVYIDVGDKTANKAAFDVLFEKKAELQAAARNNLIWNRLDNRKSSRIFIERHDSGLDQIASNPDEARRWLIERLLALKAAFGPAIPAAALVAEASRETSGSQIPELEGA